MKESTNRGIAMILLSAVIVGLLPNSAKIAYQEGANPLAVITIRCVLGMMGLGIYMLARKKPLQINASTTKASAVTGAAHALTALGLMGSVAYIDVSLATLIIFMHPFFLVVAAHFRGESRMTLVFTCCALFSLFGLVLALSVNTTNLDFRGVGLALVGSVSVCVMIIKMTTAARIMGTIRANFYMTVWASIYFMLAAILGPATGLLEPMAFPQTIRGWAGIIGTGITFTLGYLFFFLGASIIGVTRAAMISIMEIVFIILFAILLVGEWLSAVQWLGVLIIIGSLIVMELSHQKE